MKHDGGVHMTYHRYMRRCGNREVVHTSTTLLIVEVLGTESSTAPRHTQRRSRGSDVDGRMAKLIRGPRYPFAKVLPAIREIRVTNGGDGWLHDEFGRSCGLYAQRVRSRISFAQAQAPLCARIRSGAVHRRCFFLAAASKRDLAWLEFEGKARTHNKYNINAMQYKREYEVLVWKRNGLSGSQLEVQQLGSGRMVWGSVNGQKADVAALWMRICYSNFGAALKEAVLAAAVVLCGSWWAGGLVVSLVFNR
jgi:hypothetical protein